MGPAGGIGQAMTTGDRPGDDNRRPASLDDGVARSLREVAVEGWRPVEDLVVSTDNEMTEDGA
jgi:hypothetical protein